MKELIKRMPLVGKLARAIRSHRDSSSQPFTCSEDYWRARYQAGGNSGLGSYGELAEFKAEVLNDFVAEHNIASVIEFGCGDGNQLKMADYAQYTGFDISADCIASCQSMFASDPTKSFKEVGQFDAEQAELCMSLDVIYHLVEDAVYEPYMQRLFDSATRFVVIYSTDYDGATDVPHVRHRKVTTWVDAQAVGWQLHRHIPNRHPSDEGFEQGAHADFFIYERA